MNWRHGQRFYIGRDHKASCFGQQINSPFRIGHHIYFSLILSLKNSIELVLSILSTYSIASASVQSKRLRNFLSLSQVTYRILKYSATHHQTRQLIHRHTLKHLRKLPPHPFQCDYMGIALAIVGTLIQAGTQALSRSIFIAS